MTYQPLHLLLVDDEAPIVELLQEYFRALGHKVSAAGTGEQALRILADEQIDVVLTDRRMPGLSGLELLQRVRQRGDNVAFIMLTGFGTIDSAVDALKLGAQDYILKPFKLKHVHAAVRRAVDETREARETVLLRGVSRMISATRGATVDELPSLYRRLCRMVTEEYQARGALLAFKEPGSGRWVEHHRSAGDAFGLIDLDTLGSDLEEGGTESDPERYWYGPGNGAVLAAPLRIRSRSDQQPAVLGLVALVGPSHAGPTTRAGLEVFATLVADAVSLAALTAQLQRGPAEGLGFGNQGCSDELRLRVSRMVEKPMRVMQFSDGERLAVAKALMVWASGRSLRGVLERPDLLGPDPASAQRLSDVVLGITEHFDGRGSPRGRMGRDIPNAASLLAVALTWDRLRGGSAYHDALSIDQARSQLEAGAGRRFNPQVLSVFLRGVNPREEPSYTIPPDATDDPSEPSGGSWLNDQSG